MELWEFNRTLHANHLISIKIEVQYNIGCQIWTLYFCFVLELKPSAVWSKTLINIFVDDTLVHQCLLG